MKTNCKHEWKYYDGAIGYDSMKCAKCGIDERDLPKHTPGPWRVAETVKGAVCIYGRSVDPFDERPMTDHDTFIATAQKGRWTYEQAANASLIAAGPELLQALQGAVSCLERLIEKHDENFRPYSDALDIARAAIQKATGEA